MKTITILILTIILTACASTSNRVENNSNIFQVDIPQVEKVTRQEKFLKRFIGKSKNIFLEFEYSNLGNYNIILTKSPDSLLNLEKIETTMIVDQEGQPAVINFANEGSGRLSGFGPFLQQGARIEIKILFIDEKVDTEFNFVL